MKQSNRDDQEFIELVVRCLNGLASNEELRSLEEHLRSDGEKVKTYNDLCLHVHLLEDDAELSSNTNATGSAFKPAGVEEPLRVRAKTSKRRVQSLMVVAALLCGIVVGTVITWNRSGADGLVTARLPTSTLHDDAFLATLVDVDDDVVWSLNHDMPRVPGKGLKKGWMRLDSGAIDITFRSGATVHLQGPAMFGIDSCLRATLEYGGIDVYAPESATSFTVNTSAMQVVDLGTRFSMQVDGDSGQADVSVSEGEVDLHVGNAGHNASIQSLTEGQSASIGTAGEILEMLGRTIEGDEKSVGLLARWSFNELDGLAQDGDVIEDSSPHGLNGRILRSPDDSQNEIRSVDGLDGHALDLTDRGAVDLSEHVDTLGALSNFTITAWIRNPENMIFSLSDAMDRHRIQFERHQDCLVYGFQNDGQWDAVRAVVDGGWRKDQWYHVAVTMNDGSVTLYRDGQTLLGPRTTGVLLGTPVQRPVDLGRKNRVLIGKADRSESDSLRHPGWIPEQFLNGEIDDLQVYDFALDASAIRYLHLNPDNTYRVIPK